MTYQDSRIKRGSMYSRQTVWEDEEGYRFFGPIQNTPLTLDRFIEFSYDGKTPLPNIAYQLYSDVLGQESYRLWRWIIWFSSIDSVFDLVKGVKLKAPLSSDLKRILL